MPMTSTNFLPSLEAYWIKYSRSTNHKAAGPSTAIQLKPGTGSPLSVAEQKELLDLLTESPGPNNILISKERLLIEMIGGGLASYHPDTDDLGQDQKPIACTGWMPPANRLVYPAYWINSLLKSN